MGIDHRNLRDHSFAAVPRYVLERTTDPYVRSVYAEIALLGGGPNGWEISGVSYLTKRLGYDWHTVAAALQDLADHGEIEITKGPHRTATIRITGIEDPEPLRDQVAKPIATETRSPSRPDPEEVRDPGANSYGLGRNGSGLDWSGEKEGASGARSEPLAVPCACTEGEPTIHHEGAWYCEECKPWLD